MFTAADIDECETERDDCHMFAKCTNSPGSYNCSCFEGFTGDGTFCSEFFSDLAGGYIIACAKILLFAYLLIKQTKHKLNA